MIKVLKSGLFSTIQDKGRFGYSDSGVPKSGPMDIFSFELANNLLGNTNNEATIEITMIGPKLKFNVDSLFVITGANISPSINGNSIENNKVYEILKGDILSFGILQSGLRAYMAVKGGIKSKMVLGSQSYYKPLTINDKLNKDDTLYLKEPGINNESSETFSRLKVVDYSSPDIHVFKGPEFERLTENQKSELLSKEFQVSNFYNRMAYQLSQLLKNNLESILTGPVLPGTVQLTPSGKLIILMRDCQITGGYPRILQLTESAINLLSQKKEKDTIVFKLEV